MMNKQIFLLPIYVLFGVLVESIPIPSQTSEIKVRKNWKGFLLLFF